MTFKPVSSGSHPALETLSEYSSGELSPERRLVVERHLASCASCSAEFARLELMLQAARELPMSIAPPLDVWDGVRAAIAPAIPVGSSRRGRGASLLRSPWMLAAAALVLVASSSAITALVMRHDTSDVAAPSASAQPPVVALPASLARVDQEYARTAAQLEVALDARRATLAPQTIETLERSLRTIDTAIAEARRALAQDPGNRALVDIFSANYQQKLDLMKRVTELSSSI